MKFLLLVILTLASSVLFGQKFQPYDIEFTKHFEIVNEDSVYNALEGMSGTEEVRITSDLRWISGTGNTQMDEIKFTEADLRADTLNIEIFETNPVFDYKYRIRVINGDFNISFWYHTTIDSTVREIKTLEQSLILSGKEFKKGQEIRGYTEYKGECIKGCAKDKELIYIKGNFKATIN